VGLVHRQLTDVTYTTDERMIAAGQVPSVAGMTAQSSSRALMAQLPAEMAVGKASRGP
jgi:hypothetical protein